MLHLHTKDYFQCPPEMHVILPILLQYYKRNVHICRPRHSAIVSRRIRSSAAGAAAAPAVRRKRMEQLETTNMCTYWPANPAFDPKSLLLRRLFFIIEDRTKYVSVGFYPARDCLPLVEFGVFRRVCGPNTIILSENPVAAIAEGLPMLRDAVCGGNTVGVSGCTSGAFRLDVTRSCRMARLHVDSQYISLTTRH